MPKVRRGQSSSKDWSPYLCISRKNERKEWDDTRCPICMETPHNAVLMKCSSYEKGCRPYMCNTSYRHSNCLDQYCKSFDSRLSSRMLEEIPFTSTASLDSEVQSESVSPSQCGKLQPKLICPLCRGGIYGYMVSEDARIYMNTKLRSCSNETCEFEGTYPELRKHARLEHPYVRPSEVDPSRQYDWSRMEQERDFQDLFSSINASSGAEYSREDTILPVDLSDFMAFLVFEMFSENNTNSIPNVVVDSRPRVPLHDRRSETMHRVSNDTQTNQSARWRSSLPSTHQPEGIHRARWRINPPSSLDLEANRTARWRENIPPSELTHSEIVYNYYMEFSPEVRTSSTRMPRVSQSFQTNPRNDPPSELTHSEIVYNYYMESSPEVRTSSTRMPRVSQSFQTNPRNNPPSELTHSEIVYNYYMESSPEVTTSSTRMPQVSQSFQTNPRNNTSSSRRIPGRRLRWRHQR